MKGAGTPRNFRQFPKYMARFLATARIGNSASTSFILRPFRLHFTAVMFQFSKFNHAVEGANTYQPVGPTLASACIYRSDNEVYVSSRRQAAGASTSSGATDFGPLGRTTTLSL
jgi:hypothetical protein